MNHSYTGNASTVRGMHYQLAPYKEIKMVRCIAGRIYDVIIDLRAGSPTFMQWRGVELSALNKKMLFIPEGFAHGFQTLVENCEILYHHSAFYTPEAEAGIRYNDPTINIIWPLPVGTVSERDKNHPLLDNNFKGI
jgi:dTDP-4-dehydrorhamnose 3,5-epimerase